MAAEDRLESVRSDLRESAALHHLVADQMAGPITHAGRLMVKTLREGGTVILFGNGGSAADAQHIAAELVGRFERDRDPLSVIALTTDTSILTSVANDYGFERIFARQVEALARPGDLLVAMSTSGNSANVLQGVRAGKARGCRAIGLTGRGGGQLRDLVDLCLAVPSDRVCRVQEAHITIGHVLCTLVEQGLFPAEREASQEESHNAR